MQIEYEATFTNINKDELRKKLSELNAKLLKPEFLQTRVTFNLPIGHEIPGSWARVRNEGDKITMSLKIVDGNSIENQKEICLQVDNFSEAVEFLNTSGFRQKAYQESERELWRVGEAEVTIDEWPFLEPFVEIEGLNETTVKNVSEQLGFDWGKALFCSITTLYAKKYHLTDDIINNQTPRITFDMLNPFIDK